MTIAIKPLHAAQEKAWDDFVASRADHPYLMPEIGADGEGLALQRELEEKYLSGAALSKYRGG